MASQTELGPSRAAPSPPGGGPRPDAPRFTGRVLATLNEDGSRRWLEPRLSPGRFLGWRRATGYALIALFALLPLLSVNGKPAMLLDLGARRFTLLGATFYATDTIYLLLALLAAAALVFLVTALAGRVWCGWGCPQTVYMEFVFRPLERLLEGAPGTRPPANLALRRGVKRVLFVALSFALANIFLSYFVGASTLARWITRPPWEHPAGFAIVAVTTGLMLADFGWMREQVCLVACPYGRLQSVLLDKDSLIVAYDTRRGEPRGKLRGKGAPAKDAARGDCIDCNACVATCPTGIDIRDGLQLECIHCAQCIDACDAIMDRVGKPRGLVRYSSQALLAGEPRRLLRPRTIVYPLLLAAALLGGGVLLGERAPLEITVQRAIGAPYDVAADGRILNRLLVKVRNRAEDRRRYVVRVTAGGRLLDAIVPGAPLSVEPGKVIEVPVFVQVPPQALAGGALEASVLVEEQPGPGGTADRAPASAEHHVRLLGPLEGKP